VILQRTSLIKPADVHRVVPGIEDQLLGPSRASSSAANRLLGRTRCAPICS
jgi:hypothetical protein